MPVYDNKNGLLLPRHVAAPVNAALGREPGRDQLRPLVNQWLQRVDACEKAKEPFQTIANQCYQFYSKSSGFMWQDEYLRKHVGSGIQKPMFEITLQKAFELVAIFGPYLFWKYPNVWIKSEEPLELTPDLFGHPEDPMVMEAFEAAQAEQQEDVTRGRVRNSLMQKYLNYTQREQPGGGLAIHAELAITDALVKGRGTLWIQDVEFPGSDRSLTGRFYESVDCLLIDPDSRCPMLSDAQYIMLLHVTPAWKLERLFDLPKGSLRNKGTRESANSRAVNTGALAKIFRRKGEMGDLVPWYEIWSKAGVGSRLAFKGEMADYAVNEDVHNALEDVVGDYAYLCVSPSVPWPLNCPMGLLEENIPDEEIAERFQWRCANHGAPFPTYIDKRWPLAILDFYRDQESCWPIAPLAPALGELTCMNILISAYVEKCYENRKSLIATLGSAKKAIEQALTSRMNPSVVEINEAAGQTLDNFIKFIDRPEMNNDLLDGIAFLSASFDKRTGLNDRMYAADDGGTKSRTKADVDAKEEKLRIRPEKMAEDVARFMTESADLEKFLAAWTVEGADLLPLLGRYGAYFWDELIVAEDPEVLVREMRATVEASDIRKPNKERMAQNLQTMLQTLTPMLQDYAAATGDTEPINQILAGLEESMEHDFGVQLGPWQQQQDPQMAEMQQQMFELEQAKLQAEAMKIQADAQKSGAELQQKQLETELEAATGGAEIIKSRMELVQDEQEHQQEMRQDAEKHAQELMQKRQMALIDLVQKREESREKIAGMQMQNRIKAQAAKQKKAQTNGSAA